MEVVIDLTNKFDREVWFEVYRARQAMEAAMCRAHKLGLTDLANQIDSARNPIFTMLGKCSELSNQLKTMGASFSG